METIARKMLEGKMPSERPFTARISERDWRVTTAHVNLGRTYREIAQEEGVTGEFVRQIVHRTADRILNKTDEMV